MLTPDMYRELIEIALEEDLHDIGDVTTESVVPESALAVAQLIAKANGIIAGLEVFAAVFTRVDPTLKCQFFVGEGSHVKPKEVVAQITGSARSLLIAERTALNILCRLSGIASQTHEYVAKIAGTDSKILDTRKTTPGMRLLEKYAVLVGGGTNHRIGLFDAVLIKENHIAMGGGVRQAVINARKHTNVAVQIEVETLDQLKEAIEIGADMVLLDNMSPETTIEAVAIARKLAKPDFLLESSGGITLENVRDYAETGVDRISIGALTHSVKALDLSLEITPVKN